MLWYDSDGLSAFILKEVGSNDSSGPNSTPNSNFWVIKGALVTFMRICSWWALKVLINCAMQMKICLTSSEGCLAGPDFHAMFPENDELVKCTSWSQSFNGCTACNLCGWRFRSLWRMCWTLMSDMPNTWACLLANRLGLRTIEPNT